MLLNSHIWCWANRITGLVAESSIPFQHRESAKEVVSEADGGCAGSCGIMSNPRPVWQAIAENVTAMPKLLALARSYRAMTEAWAFRRMVY